MSTKSRWQSHANVLDCSRHGHRPTQLVHLFEANHDLSCRVATVRIIVELGCSFEQFPATHHRWFIGSPSKHTNTYLVCC